MMGTFYLQSYFFQCVGMLYIFVTIQNCTKASLIILLCALLNLKKIAGKPAYYLCDVGNAYTSCKIVKIFHGHILSVLRFTDIA